MIPFVIIILFYFITSINYNFLLFLLYNNKCYFSIIYSFFNYLLLSLFNCIALLFTRPGMSDFSKNPVL